MAQEPGNSAKKGKKRTKTGEILKILINTTHMRRWEERGEMATEKISGMRIHPQDESRKSREQSNNNNNNSKSSSGR